MDCRHEHFMRIALEQAEEAARHGEIPVGACIVRGEEIVALGRNTREEEQDPLGHAEITAIARAAQALGRWRLDDCTLYVTLEPCPMCAGAILNARIFRVVYGARDDKAGCLGSLCDLSAMNFPTVPYVNAGVLEEECSRQLQTFFQGLRERR